MIRKSFIIVLFIAVLWILPAWSYAEDFTIHQQFGIDTIPPSVPTGVSTTPVATTQIDVTWASSTDNNVGVLGYRVFRDSVQIATTSASQIYYSDTGLSPSTTYAYNISAFDVFFNISALSTTSSTTTLPEPIATSTGPRLGRTAALTEIEEIEVETTANSAEISFFSSIFSVASVSYGKSPQYEMGSLASDLFRKRHRFPLLNLEPDVRYYFKITAQGRKGNVVVYEDEFVTKSLHDVTPPANVSEFVAYIEGDSAVLSWKNPRQDNFDRVRVIANDRAFPNDASDGYLLYEGSGQNFTHTNVHPQFAEMYYTVFSIDKEGNRSSGAIAYVTWKKDISSKNPLLEQNLGLSSTTPEMAALQIDFSDIEFIQDASIHQGYQSVVNLDPSQPFTIRVPYEHFPEHLKTITVTLRHPVEAGRVYAFLLRINADKSYYEATIEPLTIQAQFPLEIVVLDFKQGRIVSAEGTISTVPLTDQTYAKPVRTFWQHLLFLVFNFWWGWILILLLLYFAYRLLREEAPQRHGM